MAVRSPTVSAFLFGPPRLLLPVMVLIGGCQQSSGRPPRPSTAISILQSRGDYWYARPAVATLRCSDFDGAWESAKRVLIANNFRIDRRDYREGVLTTFPLVSKQPVEFWRGDVVDGHGLVQSALGSVRRTVRIEVKRVASGEFELRPKVLIERHSIAERRVTSTIQYKDIFAYDRPLEQTTTDAGTLLNADYWYATGRDAFFERALASQIDRDAGKGICRP